MKRYAILKKGKTIESTIPGMYAGYKKGKIFGRLDCRSGMRMSKSQRVFFHTLEDAVLQDYRPCKNCKPLNHDLWQQIKHLVPEYETLDAFYNRDK